MITKKSTVSITLDARFKSTDSLERFLNRKPHWASYRHKEDLVYEVVAYCTMKEARDIRHWKALQDALDGNALCWDTYGNMSLSFDGELIGSKNGAFDKLCYTIYSLIPSETRRLFGKPMNYPVSALQLIQDLEALGLGPSYCPAIKQQVGKKMADNNCIELVGDRMVVKNLRSTMSASRLVGIIEFFELVCRYSKSTSWNKLGDISLREYMIRRIKTEFLTSIF